MTAAFVADASCGVAWVHPAQSSEQTNAMLGAIRDARATLEVPALWPLEVANALTVLVRRGKLTAEHRQVGLAWLRQLRYRLDHESPSLAFGRLSELAAIHQLTVYDAAYLELAERRRLPLACKDGPLQEAATRLGVSLWQ